MSLIACGSIHQGHERFILVMNLELRDSTSFGRKFTVLKIFTFTGIV